MANMNRVRVTWTGGPIVGPGVSTFFYGASSGIPDMVSALSTFFNAIKGQVPTGVTWSIPGSGDVLDDATGHLVGAWSGGTAATVTSAGSGSFASGVGVRIAWQTGAIHKKRRVRGSTYIVPILSSCYNSSGQVASGFITTFYNAAAALQATPNTYPLIWSRPAKGGSDGVSSSISGYSVPASVSWLRGRRT